MRPGTSRRAFLARAMAAAGGTLFGAGALRSVFAERKTASASAPESGRSHVPKVFEVRFSQLRLGGKGIQRHVLEDTVAIAAVVVDGNDAPPLDALSAIFRDDPPVTVLVDARS